MARVAGIEYGALMRQICELGMARGREWQMMPDGWALAQKLSGMPVQAAAPELNHARGDHRQHIE